jgi:outer membrane autotransporter protein
LQAGIDLYRTALDSAGFYISAATLNSDVRMPDGSAAGTVGMEGYSLGAYWTHRATAGWYSDLVLQGTRYQNIHTNAVAGDSFDTAGWGLTASGEAGYRIALGNDYSLTPQGQLIWQRTAINDGADSAALIHYDPTNEVYGRLGAKLAKSWLTDDGRTVTGWAAANVWRQFGADAQTTFSNLQGDNPTSFNAALGGTWGQVTLGVTGEVSDRVSVFGGGDYNFSLAGTGHSWGGRVGVKVAW